MAPEIQLFTDKRMESHINDLKRRATTDYQNHVKSLRQKINRLEDKHDEASSKKLDKLKENLIEFTRNKDVWIQIEWEKYSRPFLETQGNAQLERQKGSVRKSKSRATKEEDKQSCQEVINQLTCNKNDLIEEFVEKKMREYVYTNNSPDTGTFELESRPLTRKEPPNRKRRGSESTFSTTPKTRRDTSAPAHQSTARLTYQSPSAAPFHESTQSPAVAHNVPNINMQPTAQPPSSPGWTTQEVLEYNRQKIEDKRQQIELLREQNKSAELKKKSAEIEFLNQSATMGANNTEAGVINAKNHTSLIRQWDEYQGRRGGQERTRPVFKLHNWSIGGEVDSTTLMNHFLEYVACVVEEEDLDHAKEVAIRFLSFFFGFGKQKNHDFLERYHRSHELYSLLIRFGWLQPGEGPPAFIERYIEKFQVHDRVAYLRVESNGTLKTREATIVSKDNDCTAFGNFHIHIHADGVEKDTDAGRILPLPSIDDFLGTIRST